MSDSFEPAMKTTIDTISNQQPQIRNRICGIPGAHGIGLPLPEETRGERAAFAFLLLAASIAFVNAFGRWAMVAFN
jgi:hypothetical protein